jgi:AhpD family alkylhydroperoxidase
MSEDQRMSTTPRLDLYQPWPDGYKAMAAFDRTVAQSGLDKGLLELVKMRCSQVNGCAYCIDMHSKDARALGETEQRLYALSAWREAPFFTAAERAALALAEAVTLVAAQHVSDEVVEDARRHFGDDGLLKLVYAICAINAWNRLSITGLPVVGEYQPRG